MRRGLAAWVLVSALAGDAHEEARRAYDLGSAAFQSGDYGSAASHFARADELEPNDVALDAAIRALLLADDAAFGMRLVERADRRGPPVGALAKTAEEARSRFAGRVTLLRISCDACRAKLDGAPFETGTDVIVTAGVHRLFVEAGERKIEEELNLVAGTPTALSFEDKATRGASPEAGSGPGRMYGGAQDVRREPSPAEVDAESPAVLGNPWLLAGGSLTLALAAGGTGLAFATKSQHDSFVAGGCDVGQGMNCDDAASTGRRLQGLTQILFGAAVVTAVATLVLVVFGPDPRAS